jgi:hypothetical protein
MEWEMSEQQGRALFNLMFERAMAERERAMAEQELEYPNDDDNEGGN